MPTSWQKAEAKLLRLKVKLTRSPKCRTATAIFLDPIGVAQPGLADNEPRQALMCETRPLDRLAELRCRPSLSVYQSPKGGEPCRRQPMLIDPHSVHMRTTHSREKQSGVGQCGGPKAAS